MENTEEKVKAGIEFPATEWPEKHYLRERFVNECARDVFNDLKDSDKPPLERTWGLHMTDRWSVTISVLLGQGQAPSRSDEHKIMRWLKETLKLGKDTVFEREFNEYTGAFKWKFSSYNLFKSNVEGLTAGIEIVISNASHGCRIERETYLATRYKAICDGEDEQQETEFK